MSRLRRVGGELGNVFWFGWCLEADLREQVWGLVLFLFLFWNQWVYTGGVYHAFTHCAVHAANHVLFSIAGGWDGMFRGEMAANANRETPIDPFS